MAPDREISWKGFYTNGYLSHKNDNNISLNIASNFRSHNLKTFYLSGVRSSCRQGLPLFQMQDQKEYQTNTFVNNKIPRDQDYYFYM